MLLSPTVARQCYSLADALGVSTRLAVIRPDDQRAPCEKSDRLQGYRSNRRDLPVAPTTAAPTMGDADAAVDALRLSSLPRLGLRVRITAPWSLLARQQAGVYVSRVAQVSELPAKAEPRTRIYVCR